MKNIKYIKPHPGRLLNERECALNEGEDNKGRFVLQIKRKEVN